MVQGSSHRIRTSRLIIVGLLVASLGGSLLAGCSSTQPAAQAPDTADPDVVAVFAGQTLRLDEFEARYARSVGGEELALDDSLSEYEDFLERYVDFRLKVLAAEEAGYGSDTTILQEIKTYRSTLARPYLLDKEIMDPIIQQIYDRSQEIVDASHILIRVSADAAPQDTLAAYNKLSAIADSARQGADFGELALRHSEDPSSKSDAYGIGYRGRLGFFTAGRMVEPFETFAYETPVGAISPIFRTQYGYHVIKVHDRKPFPPPVRVSHIMIRPDGATPEDSAKALEQIRALKASIDAGEDFAALAREHSDDGNSASRGGDLGYIRYDDYRIPLAFREAAFALDSLRAVSDVIETQYGLHLVTITDRQEKRTLQEQYDNLKRLAARLPRTKKAERALAAEIRDEYEARVDTVALLHAFETVPQDSVLAYLKASPPAGTDSIAFASLGDSTYTLGQLATFARSAEIDEAPTRAAQLLLAADAFLDDAALAYAAATLEKRDAEFRTLMQEFRDGLLLFKLMEDSVWTAASRDTAALLAHFEAHRDDFWFPERTRIIELYSPSDSLLQATMQRLDDGLTLAALEAELAADTTARIAIDTVRVSESTHSIYDHALKLESGGRTDLLRHRNGFVVLMHDGTEAPRPKTFDEALPEVISSYQEVLEDRVVARLRRKYRAQTFPERLDRAFVDRPERSEPVSATQ